MPPDQRQSNTSQGPSGFPATRWSVVDAAGKGDSEDAVEALNQICRDYWYPLYAFARRSGQSVENAEDLTQGFFCALVNKGWLSSAQREKGKLRTFLLTAFRRYMAKEWRRAQAEIRGGGISMVPLESGVGESRYAAAQPGISADQLFDRQWALTLMARTVDRLENEFAQAGKEEEFDALKDTLMAARGEIDYAGMAHRLGMNEGAIRVAVHRLRKRFRATLRGEIERTLAEGEDVESELRHLAHMLAR